MQVFWPGRQKLNDELEAEIERLVDQPIVVADPAQLGKARRINDAIGRYIEFCKSTYTADQSLAGLRIVWIVLMAPVTKLAPRYSVSSVQSIHHRQ